MKNIQRKQTKFHYFLETLIYIFRICFDAIPEVKPRPNICFDSKYDRDTKAVERMAFNFELKKRGAR